MPKRVGRLWAVMLTLAIASGAFIGVASAGRLSLSETRWRIHGTVESEDGSGGFRITCPVTVSGSFYARTLAKVRAAIGEVTSETVNEAACTGAGRMRIETRGFPYRMEYESFTGTLPNIREIRTRNSTIVRRYNLYNIFLLQWCGYEHDPAIDHSYTVINALGVAVHLGELRYISGPEGCPPFLITPIRGTMLSTGGAALTIRLI